MQAFGRNSVHNTTSLKASAATLRGLRTSLFAFNLPGDGGDGLNSNKNRDITTSALQERLEEVLVLELLKDGGRNYLTLSVRSLYQHVLAAITTPHNILPPVMEDHDAVKKNNNNNGDGNDRNRKNKNKASPDSNERNSSPSISPNTNDYDKNNNDGEGGRNIDDGDGDDDNHMIDALLEPLPPRPTQADAVGAGAATLRSSQSTSPPPPQHQYQPPLPPSPPLVGSDPGYPAQQQAQPDASAAASSTAGLHYPLHQPQRVSPPPVIASSALHLPRSHRNPEMEVSFQTEPGESRGATGRGRFNPGGASNFVSPRASKKFVRPSVTRLQQQAMSAHLGNSGYMGAAGGPGMAPGVAGVFGPGGGGVTYRERLGAYLHPRDMRKLVTPFSSSNEPDLIVRRHAMLMNFDPLRTIILRDRLLVLVPDGADSILVDLERRVRGGHKELEDVIFGRNDESNMDLSSHSSLANGSNKNNNNNNNNDAMLDDLSANERNKPKPSLLGLVKKTAHRLQKGQATSRDIVSSLTNSDTTTFMHQNQQQQQFGSGFHPAALRSATPQGLSGMTVDLPKLGDDGDDGDPSEFGTNPTQPNSSDNNDDNNDKEVRFSLEAAADDEWADLQGREWINLPFELQCADAVLQTVVELLSKETLELEQATVNYIDEIINRNGGVYSREDPLTIIRAIKDSVREMTARVKGFVQSMNTILDDYEDMALMNLSRLITHPELFIQPVPAEVLEEESDEPELILESFLQQGLSLVNAVNLIEGQIGTAAELVDQKLDATRNKILLANTVITTVALCVDFSMVVSSMFGMNLANPWEDSDSAFVKVALWTLAGSTAVFLGIMFIMYRTGTIPSWGRISEGGL
ncbi:hypothetical protein ACA910_006252 [Epithemia clementina (nom. ined.)]